jgi:hypothetical protein
MIGRASRHSVERRGEIIARAVAGSWRDEPNQPQLCAAELAPCVDALVRSGAGALVWRRVRSAEYRDDQRFRALRAAHHMVRLRAELDLRDLSAILSAMRAMGIEPVLLKGWSIAAKYARPELRPMGDVDLLIRSTEVGRAETVAVRMARGRAPIDLHSSLLDLSDRSVADLFAHSRLVCIGGVETRVLGAEDHLRHLCLHFFRHAGSRPLWLCDIAVALETMTREFDWDRCLSGDTLLTERVIAAVSLARTLLCARLAHPMPAGVGYTCPRWLIRGVLRSWGRPFDPRVFHPTSVYLSLRRPYEILPALLRRWPDPLEATVQRAVPLTGRWRPLVQLHEAAIRAARLIPRLARAS